MRILIGLMLCFTIASTPAIAGIKGGVTDSSVIYSDTISRNIRGELPDTTAMTNLAIPFVANIGQMDKSVAYYARMSGGTVFVTSDGNIVYGLLRPVEAPGEAKKHPDSRNSLQADGNHRWILHEKITGMQAVPKAGSKSPTTISVFRGTDKTRWHTNVPAYNSLHIENAFPGVDVELQARSGTVEKIFTVAPGKDPRAIRMRLDGQDQLLIGDQGQLISRSLSFGEVSFSAPVAWQIIADEKQPVDVSWAIISASQYGFKTGDYDHSKPLVIDPVFQSTYLGGSGNDSIRGMHIDNAGNIYVWGDTDSMDFPGTLGGAQPANASGTGAVSGGDIVIARLSEDLTTIKQATYLGGSSDDGSAVFLQAADGSVYVAGSTGSVDFPTTTGSAQPATSEQVFQSGGVSFTAGDGFVAHLSADLGTLLAATYLGGSSLDQVMQLARAPGGGIYATGFTGSSDFPGSAGGAQAAFATGGSAVDTDVFVTLLSADLSSLIQTTYFGGSGRELAFIIRGADFSPAGDGTGVYLYGTTSSDNLPGTVGGAQPAFGGGTPATIIGFPADYFLVKLSNDLTSLIQATYLGGSSGEADNINISGGDDADVGAFFAGGSIYTRGNTASPDYPGITNGIRDSGGGGVITRLSSDLKTILQSTYLGGGITDMLLYPGGDLYTCGVPFGTVLPGPPGGAQETLPPLSNFTSAPMVTRITADLRSILQATLVGDNGLGCTLGRAPDGSLYVSIAAVDTGNPGGLPLTGGIGGMKERFTGGNDILLVQLAPDLKSFIQATYFGGTGEDRGGLHTDNQGQLVTRNGNLYVLTDTKSVDFPGTAGGAQAVFGGVGTFGGDGAVSRLPLSLLGSGGTPVSPRSADLVIDFGSIGLWARLNDTSWQKLNNSSPDQMVVGDVDGNGQDDVIGDFSSTFGGIFVKRNGGGWSKLHNAAPEAMSVGDLDNNGKDDVVIDFGSIGLWARMNDSAWLKLNNASPTQLVVGDMDGNGEDDVIAVFSSGIFVKRNLGGWTQLHNFIPEAMAVGDLDGNGKDDIVIDFGGIALWARMNDSSWLKLNNSSPDLITTGDLDGNGSDDVIATFSGIGLWQKLNLGGWGQLNPNAPDEVITADVDGSGKDDIIAKFGSTIGGIFVKRNQGSWSKLHNFNPDSLAVGNLDAN